MKTTFTETFRQYACAGDSIECHIGDLTIRAAIEYDADSSPNDYDCYDEGTKQAWKDDDWFFCGIVLSLWIDDLCIDKHAAGLWSIECNYPGSDNSYLTEVAKDLLSDNWQDIKATFNAFRSKVEGLECVA